MNLNFYRAVQRFRDTGGRTPCEEGDGAAWLSDERAVRVRAATACRDCTFRVACHTEAEEAHVDFGVWGGADFTPRRSFTDHEAVHRLHRDGVDRNDIATQLDITRNQVDWSLSPTRARRLRKEHAA